MTLRRVIDLAGATICLLIVCPVMLFTIVAIYLTDGGPILFLQQRSGLRGRPFLIYKFRSMKANNLPCDDVTEIRSGHPLVTPVGSLIRRYKIDELPQLVNVLKGEMSLIGPRPTVPEQVDGFSPFEWRRQEILPGLTGWAQINGGIDITWPERIKLDVWYVDHRSAWLDISILLRTITVVLWGDRPNPEKLAEAEIHAINQPGTS
jgi:lipopolysaccharide/colanic/teichoic acid biosynthesis glycosyltransferase